MEEVDARTKGWVKLIDKSWIPRSEMGRRPDPNVHEAIEGVTEDDVGWMKCPYQSVMDEWYVILDDLNGWVIRYERPPAIAGYYFS